MGFTKVSVYPILEKEKRKLQMLAKSFIPTLITLLVLNACQDSPPTPINNQASDVQAASSASSESLTARLPDTAPIIHVLTTGSVSPFNFRDENGNVIGFEPDLIEAIAANQGMRVQIIPKSWEQVWATIDKNPNEPTLAMNTIGITEERQKKYLLSESYVRAPNALAVLKDSPIQTVRDANGKKISVMQGSTIILDEIKAQNIKPAQLVNRNSLYLTLGAITNHSADVAWGDKLVMAYYAKNMNVPIRFIDLPNDGVDDRVVFILNKKDTELLDKINRGLANLKADGTYDKIYQKWFGTK